MKIFLCRHGQTTGDIEDRYGGDYEDHLTEEGKIQAQGLAEKLADKNIEVIFSSPRIRAVETAEMIKLKVGVDVKVLENLRERNHYGVLTGMVKAEAKDKYPEDVERVKDYRNNATNGEGYEDFKARIEMAWKEILESGYQTVAVVSHGGPIRTIFREILKYGEIKIADCAYVELSYEEGKLEIVVLNGIKSS